MTAAAAPLEALEAALEQERQALLLRDVEQLLESTRAKLEALGRIEAGGFSGTSRERVEALFELNRSNGALLIHRRREVNWALRHLGMNETRGTYGADGSARAKVDARHLATV